MHLAQTLQAFTMLTSSISVQFFEGAQMEPTNCTTRRMLELIYCGETILVIENRVVDERPFRHDRNWDEKWIQIMILTDAFQGS